MYKIKKLKGYVMHQEYSQYFKIITNGVQSSQIFNDYVVYPKHIIL